jgi:repressor LexA
MARRSQTREAIFRFIRSFRETHGYSPSVREIAQHCAITSTSVVQHHLQHLEREGLITRTKERFRTIGIPGDTAGLAQVPLLGTIAAGHPIWVPAADRWSAEAQRMIPVPEEITGGRRAAFALQVRGNSMVDAMIADGDVVILEQATEIADGDVAACWLKTEQEVTLKKVFFENGTVRLQPCNPYMLPLYHDADNVEIQGRVIAVIRTKP